MIRRLLAAIRRAFGLQPALVQAGGHVVYEAGACRECGRTTAVINGRCWHCRTGNPPVEEPMTWAG